MNSSNTVSQNMYTSNMFNQPTETHRTYRTFANEADVFGAAMLLTTTLAMTGRSRRCLRRWYASSPDLLSRRPVVEAASSRVERFPKPNSPSPVHDHKGNWFQRPALPFAGGRRRSGWSRLRWRCKARDWQNLDWFVCIAVHAALLGKP